MHNNQELNDLVIHLLKTRIPVNYYYHNYEHTLYVMDKVLEIGRQENCTTRELELLWAAALFHDTGHIHCYRGHEEASCELARTHLPGYAFSPDDINTICGMIMATKIPQSPQNKLEEIIADADLEYLGTPLAPVVANHLFKELQALNPLLTEAEWNQIQINFLTAHRYFTEYCKTNKDHIKRSYLQSLISDKA